MEVEGREVSLTPNRSGITSFAIKNLEPILHSVLKYERKIVETELIGGLTY